jgi:uncharacterized protein DUF998
MTRSTLGRAAAGLISVFPLIVLVLHGVQSGSYHPMADAVSELALGRGGWLMTIAFCSLGTGTLFLAAMLRRLEPPTRVGPILIGCSGALSYVSAFVHADGPHGTTTHGQIHQAVGVATFILLIAGMFSLVRPFRRDARFHALATPTLVWAVAAVGGFFAIPLSGSAYFGVAQRVLLAVMLSWAITVAVHGARDRARADARLGAVERLAGSA